MDVMWWVEDFALAPLLPRRRCLHMHPHPSALASLSLLGDRHALCQEGSHMAAWLP